MITIAIIQLFGWAMLHYFFFPGLHQKGGKSPTLDHFHVFVHVCMSVYLSCLRDKWNVCDIFNIECLKDISYAFVFILNKKERAEPYEKMISNSAFK